MKKFISIIVCLVMLLAMSGCDKIEQLEAVELPPLPTAAPEKVEEPAQESEENSAAETELPQEEAEADKTVERYNQVIVSNKQTVIQEFDPAEGKELILTFAYDTPNVYIDGRDEAAARINDYLEFLDESYYTGNNHGHDTDVFTGGYNMMLELAQDHFGYVYSSGSADMPLEFTASRTASVSRADSGLLSIVYSIYQYTGGAHGVYADRAYVFDTETGEELSLDRITSDFDAFAAFLTQYMVDIAEYDENIKQRIDTGIIPEEGFSAAFGALLREGSWYFSPEGLVIFSDIYELGSYAQGIVEFVIPYRELEGKIHDKYLPEERQGEAKLKISYLADMVEGSTNICDLVLVNEEGEDICVIINGTAYDVKVSAGDYSGRFFETSQLWYASYIQNGAVQIKTVIPEGMPNLMFSCTDSLGDSHRWLISQSGIDGSLLLVDESIEAVG